MRAIGTHLTALFLLWLGAAADYNAKELSEHSHDWRNLTLVPPFVSAEHYQPPQYMAENGFVTFRGWFKTADIAEEGMEIFRLPADFKPYRIERFSVRLKGQDRELSVSPEDGVARLVHGLDSSMWVPLVSFSYQSISAAPELYEPPAAIDGLGIAHERDL